MIYDKDNVYHEPIIGEIPEGNLSISDILNYLQISLINIINILHNDLMFGLIFQKYCVNVFSC